MHKSLIQLNPQILSQDQKEIKKLCRHLVFFCFDCHGHGHDRQQRTRFAKKIIIGPQKNKCQCPLKPSTKYIST